MISEINNVINELYKREATDSRQLAISKLEEAIVLVQNFLENRPVMTIGKERRLGGIPKTESFI